MRLSRFCLEKKVTCKENKTCSIALNANCDILYAVSLGVLYGGVFMSQRLSKETIQSIQSQVNILDIVGQFCPIEKQGKEPFWPLSFS